MLLNNEWIAEEIEKEIKKICEDKWKWKHNDPKPMGCSKSSSKMDNLVSNLKELEKEKQIKPKANRKKELIKVRVEINEIETKKQ